MSSSEIDEAWRINILAGTALWVLFTSLHVYMQTLLLILWSATDSRKDLQIFGYQLHIFVI